MTRFLALLTGTVGALLVLLAGAPAAHADAVDDAVLITTELVTNAIVHAGTTFHVVVELQGRLLRIAVVDGCTRPPRRRTDRGLGLRIVTRTALRWGWREYDTGKTVWAEVFV